MNTPAQAESLPSSSVVVSINGKHLWATTVGHGPTVVLLHSLLSDHRSFDPIIAPLSKTHRVLVLSLPGFGKSTSVYGGIGTVADHLTAALREMCDEHPTILLGNGYGAFISMTMAIRHPDAFTKLIVVGCGTRFSESGRAAFRQMSATARQKGLAAITDTAMQRLFSPSFQSEHPELITERRRQFLAIDSETFHNACDSLATLDLREGAAGLRLRSLVLVGELDEATPPPMGKDLAETLPNATFRLLNGCAHVPQLQEPELFISATRDFLASP